MVVRPYLTYLCWREQMNISSTVARRFFSKSLVGTIVLVEECGDGVESIAKFSDLGASGVV